MAPWPISIHLMDTHAESPSHRSGSHHGVSFEHDAHALLARLQSAFAAMLAESRCPAPLNAAEVERALGLDKKLGWQTYRVVNAPNAIAAGFAVPSIVSTRRLAAAARKRGASAKSVAQVQKTVEEFEQFVRTHADDRAEFESMIADWAADGREPIDIHNRRAAFAAMSRLRGSTMSTMLNTVIAHPAPDGQCINRANLMGYFGLRRLRPSARLGAGTLWYPDAQPQRAEQTLAGNEISDPNGALLPEFCSEPMPRFETTRTHSGLTQFWLTGTQVGLQTAADVLLGFRKDQFAPRYRTPERPTAIHSIIPSTPTRRMIFDCIIHKDLLQSVEPRVMVHEVAGNGPIGTHAEYEARTPDLLDWCPPVRALGMGIDRFLAPWLPNYTQILSRAFNLTGWDHASFFGYRLEVEYPVHSWQCSLVFQKPESPVAIV